MSGLWKEADLSEFDELSRALKNEVTKKGAALEGHSAVLVYERKMYVTLARMEGVQRICEIGFHAGHSAALWLLANPTAGVIMFDLWAHSDYAALGEKFLRGKEAEAFGLRNADQRLQIVKGSSLEAVPNSAAETPI